MRPSSFFALVRDERIPEFVKHPLSLKVYYANPRLYGWGGIIVGMLALCVGAALAIWSVLSGAPQAVLGSLLFFLPMGLILVLVGYWMATRVD